MGWACGMYAGEDIHIAFWWSNQEERNQLEARPLDGTLKRILNT